MGASTAPATKKDVPMPSHPDVPADKITDANAKLARCATIDAELETIDAELNAEIARLAEKAQRRAQELVDELAELNADLKEFGEEHREALTKGGKVKTIKFPAGELAWRSSTESLEVEDKDAAIRYMLQYGNLKELLEIEYKLPKDELKRQWDRVKNVPGLRLVPGGAESFLIKPSKARVARRSVDRTPSSEQDGPDEANAA